MKLIIVESPTKSKTISKFLGPNYRVLSSYGHIRDLPKSELGVDVEQGFKPKYIIPTRARKIINLLKSEVKKSETIILATDEDREGESIAWHLAQTLGFGKSEIRNPKSEINSKFKIQNSKPPYQRIVFHEITKQAIEDALKNPRDIDINLVDAQQARRILDRLVGYKLSPFLWKKVARGLSAGRVQSIAVRLVVEREREIQKFIPQEYWTIVASLLKNNEFEAILIKKNGEVIPKLGIKTKEEADEILKNLEGAEYKVANIEKKEVKRNPPPPFMTSTLQQESWKKFHWPAKMTMRIAQQLYETGKITYHRTDSLNLSDLSLAMAKKFIMGNYGENYYQFRKFKTKSKSAQEAHEAIRPSEPNLIPESIKTGLEENQFRLYDLIWRRFISSQMNQAIFDSTAVDISAKQPAPYRAEGSGAGYIFRATGQILKFDGFLKVYPMKFEENELPSLEKEEILELVKLNPAQHFTQPPPRYTEATLIKTLEENGIGRPSTYAPTLSTIQERNYIEKDENGRFKPTEIGTVVNDLLVNHFPQIVDISFTAKMEEDLDKIAGGEKKWVPVINEFYQPFAENLEKKYQEVSKEKIAVQKTDKICPKCGAPLLIRLGKFGKFYACSNFPKCRYTESLEENKLKVNCPKCGSPLVEKRTKKRKIFYGCSSWPKCDFALWDKPTGEKCPKCGSLLVETKRKQVKCSNKSCDFKKEKE
ncbi:type I DNA topoisomerase [Patescibacteria group bacterium]|nr:type I DNA topoisomerase [Patescibacteria group bacterium]MBU4481766.1 type I DNA topoisomerase [Patescibacteria group bacterium]